MFKDMEPPAVVGCFLTAVIALGVLSIGSCQWVGGIPYEYSSGERTGTIFKFSRKGMMFKSWEGQLMIGTGRDNTGAVVPLYWDFSCTDPDVAKLIEAAQRKQQAVTIEYSQQLVRNARIADTSYYAIGVKEQTE